MYLRLTFNIFGENFNAEHCKDVLYMTELKTIFDVNYPHNLSFVHSNEFSKEYWDEQYEESYYVFIKNNIDVLKDYGANEFDIFIEVYKQESEQCNFQILDQKFLKLVGDHEISLPISIYTVFENDEF